MKTTSGPLLTLLNSSTQFSMADLFEFTTVSGVSRYTNADRDVTYNSNVYASTGPLMKRTGLRSSVGLETDTATITVAASASHLLEGLPFVQASIGGALDNADVVIYRAFFTSFLSAPTGALLMFSGSVSDVHGSRNQVKIEVKADVELLTVKMPRNVYQPPCVNTLFDSACGLQRTAFQLTVTANGGTINSFTSANPSAAGYFNQGTARCTSGPNVGLKRTVKTFTGGAFTFALAWPYAVSNGDVFVCIPGCDKLQGTCNTKFGNLTRFRGYPYVPNAEVAL